MNLYKLERITRPDGRSREDGRYPVRLGSTYEILFLEKEKPMLLSYVLDNKGNSKEGALRTSTVKRYEYVEDDKLYIVETLNTIYYLHKIAMKQSFTTNFERRD